MRNNIYFTAYQPTNRTEAISEIMHSPNKLIEIHFFYYQKIVLFTLTLTRNIDCFVEKKAINDTRNIQKF